MIKTQDLKTQIDELAKQNDMMLTELEQMKQLISEGQPGQSNQSNQSSGGNQNQSRQSSGSSAGQQGQGGNQAQQQSQGNNNTGNQSQSGGGDGGQAVKLANELLQIKDMVSRLEEKTSQYVSSQANGTLTDKDVVNLVLILINGMVDWASDFVSSHASSSGQKQ